MGSGNPTWSFSGSAPYQPTNYDGALSGSIYANGSGGSSFNYTEHFTLDPSGIWLATSGSGSASGSSSITTGFSASGSFSDYEGFLEDPAVADLPGFALSAYGTASLWESDTTSYQNSTSSVFTPSEGWSSTGSASATSSGDTGSSFSAVASYAGYYGSDPYSSGGIDAPV